MTNPPTILQKIVAHKIQEVARQKELVKLKTLKVKIAEQEPPRNFVQALQHKIQAHQAAVIAEIKRASPSQGIIRDPFDPVECAQSYAHAGAACLSILTDHHFFQGQNAHLEAVRKTCSLPILRKDFMVDSYQFYEARALGADCVLLIVAILTDEELIQFTELAQALQMSVLVEVHDGQELQRALKLPTPLIGINNRDLHTFKTDINTSLALMKDIPGDRLVVSESGIHDKESVRKLESQGIHAFLVGESFMRAGDPGRKLRELFGEL